MDRNNPTKKEDDASILADIGENYYYLKTIITNRIEIAKLELLQNISGVVSFLIFSIMLFFVLLLIIILLIVAGVVYLSQIVGSYVTAILIINGVLILLAILAYVLFKPTITKLLENKMLKLFNEKQLSND
jgi:hypothetical protein